MAAVRREALMTCILNVEILTYGFAKELREVADGRVFYNYMKADERQKKP